MFGEDGTDRQVPQGNNINDLLKEKMQNPGMSNIRGLGVPPTTNQQKPINPPTITPTPPTPPATPITPPGTSAPSAPSFEMFGGQQANVIENKNTINETVNRNNVSTQTPNTQNQPPINKTILIGGFAVFILLGMGMIFLKVKSGPKKEVVNQQQQVVEEVPEIPEVVMGTATMPDGSLMVVEIKDGEPVIPPRDYTDEQKQALRNVGYTGDDIEKMQVNWEDPNRMIKEGQKALDAYIDKLVEERSNKNGSEYRKLLKQTHLGQGSNDEDINENIERQKEKEVNLDYEKLPAVRNQLPVKLYLDDEDDTNYIIWFTTVDVYRNLKSRGNIVVTLTYEDGGTDNMYRYVVGIKESN